MPTPEGKVKNMVRRHLQPYKGLYEYWPVPSGYGASSLDCLVCYKGTFIAIETKAPGKKPTPRQEACIKQIRDAGGYAYVIDGPECDDFTDLIILLDSLSQK